jgi:hypothetical protein
MDTRFLATTQGNIVAERVVQEYAAFVQTTVVRGVAPCWLASTVEKQPPVKSAPGKPNNKGTSASTIRVQLTPLGNDKARKTMGGRALFSLSKVQVQASANENDNENDNAKGAVYIPKELLATNSWKVLGKLGTYARVLWIRQLLRLVLFRSIIHAFLSCLVSINHSFILTI